LIVSHCLIAPILCTPAPPPLIPDNAAFAASSFSSIHISDPQFIEFVSDIPLGMGRITTPIAFLPLWSPSAKPPKLSFSVEMLLESILTY
jgi:hypothetical protein